MAAKKKPPVDPAREHCCQHLKMVEEYSTGAGPRALAGVQVAHVFNSKTGEHKWSPLVYILPARGRGKERTSQTVMLVQYCPFCGTKQKERESP